MRISIICGLNRTHLLAVALSATCLLGSGCEKDSTTEPEPPDEPTYGSVEGTVCKAGTEIPIEGVRVSIESVVSTTDSSGLYQLDRIETGSRTLRAERTNYETFEQTITVYERTNTFGISMTSLLTQRLFGTVLNSRRDGIPGASVQADAQGAITTDHDGDYEILDLGEGAHTLAVHAEDYLDTTVTFTMPEGEKELDVLLTAALLPQVSGLGLSDGSYSIYVSWTDLTQTTLGGYTVYERHYYWHTLCGRVEGCYIHPNYTDWDAAHSGLLTQSSHSSQTEEYNAGYGFYVLPTNIDGHETPHSGSTSEEYMHLETNCRCIGEFSLTDNYGPVTLPDSNDELALYMKYAYDRFNLFYPSDWTVEISEDASHWTQVGANGISEGGAQESNGGYLMHFSLNAYEGKTVYFRTVPPEFGGNQMTIVNRIREYIY